MSHDELLLALDALRLQWEKVYELLLSRVQSSSAAMVTGPYARLDERIKKLEMDLVDIRAALAVPDGS